MRAVRILLDGLICDGSLYRAGQVEPFPSPRLLELAGGEPLHGQIAVEFVEEVGPSAAAALLPGDAPRAGSEGRRRQQR